MLHQTGFATQVQEMHIAAALRHKGYTPFFSSCLAEAGSTSTSRGGGLLTAVSSKYLAEHEVLSFTELVPGKARALEIRAHKGGLTLINVHGPQAGCSPWAGWAAFWADIQMYATARSLGGRHPVVIAGDTNIYMDAATNPATEHLRSGWEACGFRRATAGGVEDITPTLHPSRHRVDTFLVNEPLSPAGSDPIEGDPPESGKQLQAVILRYDALAAWAPAAYQASGARQGVHSEAALRLMEALRGAPPGFRPATQGHLQEELGRQATAVEKDIRGLPALLAADHKRAHKDFLRRHA